MLGRAVDMNNLITSVARNQGNQAIAYYDDLNRYNWDNRERNSAIDSLAHPIHSDLLNSNLGVRVYEDRIHYPYVKNKPQKPVMPASIADPNRLSNTYNRFSNTMGDLSSLGCKAFPEFSKGLGMLFGQRPLKDALKDSTGTFRNFSEAAQRAVQPINEVGRAVELGAHNFLKSRNK